jgi:hypothetical protein
MEPNTGYVIAAYVLTVLALGGYLARLHARARDARRAADAVASRRRRR